MDGYEVSEADSGKSGLAMIRSDVPDLIICDINMPEMSGDELFAQLRQSDSEFSIIPFIFLSGTACDCEKIERLNKGADNCFEKPIDFGLLLAHVNAQLSRLKRESKFIKAKLDAIAKSISETIQHDFDDGHSWSKNFNGYVDSILTAVRSSNGGNGAEHTAEQLSASRLRNGMATEPVSANQGIISRADFVRFCLTEHEKRKALVRTTNGEDLSWLLIFLVTKAQIEQKKMPVSDLYVSAYSAKSTISARINSLIEEGIFQKSSDTADGRRQLVSLTDYFYKVLLSHIDSCVHMISQTVLSAR